MARTFGAHQADGTGFTLIEILVAVAIVAILAAVLIPLLLSPRGRAYDTGTQSCLKEIGANQEAIAAQDPFSYSHGFDPTAIRACEGVIFSEIIVTDTMYSYTGKHAHGRNTYRVTPGTSVRIVPSGG